MKTLQFEADWCETRTSKQMEKEYHGFKFTGAGWYFTKTDTLLVIPLVAPKIATRAKLWHSLWPKNQKFLVYAWDRDVSEIFNAIVNAPVRADTRD